MTKTNIFTIFLKKKNFFYQVLIIFNFRKIINIIKKNIYNS